MRRKTVVKTVKERTGAPNEQLVIEIMDTFKGVPDNRVFGVEAEHGLKIKLGRMFAKFKKMTDTPAEEGGPPAPPPCSAPQAVPPPCSAATRDGSIVATIPGKGVEYCLVRTSGPGASPRFAILVRANRASGLATTRTIPPEVLLALCHYLDPVQFKAPSPGEVGNQEALAELTDLSRRLEFVTLTLTQGSDR